MATDFLSQNATLKTMTSTNPSPEPSPHKEQRHTGPHRGTVMQGRPASSNSVKKMFLVFQIEQFEKYGGELNYMLPGVYKYIA